MNSTYAVRELVESGRSGWVARGLAGPTSEVLIVIAADFGWLFREVTLEGATTHNELMDALGRQLELPDYFGRNWDALDECLADLGQDKGGVLLRLKALKSLPEPLARTLIDILNDRVCGDGTPCVVVADPPLPVIA